MAKGDYDSPVSITISARTELHWWVDNVTTTSNDITPSDPDTVAGLRRQHVRVGGVFVRKIVQGACGYQLKPVSTSTQNGIFCIAVF